jgi:hypothetical protein
MRKRGAATIAALVGLGLAVSIAPAQAQSYRPAPTFQGRLWDNMFSGTPKVEDTESGPVLKGATPVTSAPLAKDSSTVKVDQPVGTVADRAREQDRLMKVFLRREAVSDRIRDIGVATSNAALIEEAAYLREKAWQIYVKQSGNLLGTAVPLGADDLEKGKPVHSAAALSQAAQGGNLGRMRNGSRPASENERQTSVLREDER